MYLIRDILAYFRYMLRRYFPKNSRDAARQFVTSLSGYGLEQFSQLVAAHRRLKPWPGWKFDVVVDDEDHLTILRQEIISFVRQNHRDFFINYHFQPGTKIHIRLTEAGSRNLFTSGCVEPNEFAFFNTYLKPGMTFFDLGANMGLYTVLAAKRVGEKGLVVALEPSTREFARLSKNVELNKFKNVHLLNIAASNSMGTATLHISDENEPGHNTLGVFIYPGVQEVKLENVRLDTIDNIVRDLQIKHVDAIKMDIEGHEFFALQGMTATLKKHHPILLTEISVEALQKQGCTPQPIFSFMRELNYKAMIFDETTGLPVPIFDWQSGVGNSVVFIPA